MNRLTLSINGVPINAPSQLPNAGVNTLQSLIQTGINLFLIFAVLVALFYLIQGGIQWITSSGDKQLIDQARLRITYAIIGLIVALMGFTLVNFVFKFFNLSLS